MERAAGLRRGIAEPSPSGWWARPLGRRALLRGVVLGGAGIAASVLLGCEDEDGGTVTTGEHTVTTDEQVWGYAGPAGPAHWASLAEAHASCGGRHQSPVDITGYQVGDAGPLVFLYATPAEAVRNDGAFVHVDYPEGNTLVSSGQTYALQSAHLHAPSEHTIDGEGFAAELHLVHEEAGGDLAVVGLLFTLGEPSPVVQAVLDAAPPGETVEAGVDIHPGDYVPVEPSYFRYDGSTTTPPCEEQVAWHVMREVRTISQAQVDGLLALSGGPNSRPLQPHGSRVITLGGGS